jgi:hypothetical protein
MIEIRFDKTKDEVALLIWFLVDHSVLFQYILMNQECTFFKLINLFNGVTLFTNVLIVKVYN